MKPIEAMARALFSIANDDDEWTWEDYVEPARAALTALRDNGVTEGMWMSWLDSNDMNATQTECNRQFRAMLDAALGEE